MSKTTKSSKKNKHKSIEKVGIKEVPSRAEESIKIGDIVNNSWKIIHIYEDGRFLVSNKDCAKVIETSDIK